MTLSLDQYTPVIVGVGAIVDRLDDKSHSSTNPGANLKEPLDLITEAITKALADAEGAASSPSPPRARSSPLGSVIDSVAIVPPWAWSYDDLPRLVAQRAKLGRFSDSKENTSSGDEDDDDDDDDAYVSLPHGGNQPVASLDRACRLIASGKIRAAVVAGGDALASLGLWKRMAQQQKQKQGRDSKSKTGGPPSWTPLPPGSGPLDLKEIHKAMEESAATKTDDSSGDTVAKGPHQRLPLSAASETAAAETSAGQRHGANMPVFGYALAEMRRRVRTGMDLAECQDESRRLYARFEGIAETIPEAWGVGSAADDMEARKAWLHGGGRDRRSSNSKTTASPDGKDPWGRPVSLPYHLLECAQNGVNLAAAVVIVSAATAASLGLAGLGSSNGRDSGRVVHPIFPLAAHGAEDEPDVWSRRDIGTSDPMAAVLRTVVTETADHHNGTRTASPGSSTAVAGNDEPLYSSASISPDLIDIYSCFPIVPKLAAELLGLPPAGTDGTPLSLIGGLTFFGGAGNNYSMHALVEAVRRLRAEAGKTTTGKGGAEKDTALVLANGGVMTYLHAVVLSSRPSRFSLKPKSGVSSTSSGDGDDDPAAYRPFVTAHEPEMVPRSPWTPDLVELVSDVVALYPPSHIRRGGTGPSTEWIPAIVESYTITYGSKGTPEQAIIVGRLVPPPMVGPVLDGEWGKQVRSGKTDGDTSSSQYRTSSLSPSHPPPTFSRFVANAATPAVLEEIMARERSGHGGPKVIGAVGWCATTDGRAGARGGKARKRNVFAFDVRESSSGQGQRVVPPGRERL